MLLLNTENGECGKTRFGLSFVIDLGGGRGVRGDEAGCKTGPPREFLSETDNTNAKLEKFGTPLEFFTSFTPSHYFWKISNTSLGFQPLCINVYCRSENEVITLR